MFESLLTERETSRNQFTIYRSGDRTPLEDWLSDHGVTVTAKSLPEGGPDSFVEILRDEEVVGIIGLQELETLLEPPIVRPTDEGVSTAYRVVFDVLDETLFTSLNRRELLAISREIEERAYRVENGTLRVSFQQFSTFMSQIEVYRVLATETALDIHIYGTPDWIPPEISGITYHEDEDERIRQYWALAFDGGLDQRQMCGLVAREHGEGYRGCWTNEPEMVSELLRIFESLS